MRTHSTVRFATCCCFLMLVAASGCNRAPEAAPAATPAPVQPEFVVDATIKDLMLNIVDTSADTVWLSVTTEVSSKGMVETRPRNDDEWLKVKQGALTLAEAANLLMIPGRHVARPGEKSETPGVELEPSEMEVMINKDRGAWNQRARALHEAAREALQAAEAHDADKIFEIGEHIEVACENCHKQYWYPNEQIPGSPTE